jgi:hypothetical protein
VIGIYGGIAPGATWAGGEFYHMIAYDRQTGQVGLYFYSGATAGPSIGNNAIGGYFLFDGPMDALKGWSWGVQGAAGIAVGYSRTANLSGPNYNMVQIGVEVGVSAEVTFGFTMGTDDVARVDWQLTEQTLARIYGGHPELLASILVELAMAKSLGGQWQTDFVEKYGDLVSLVARSCFAAGTPIEMADGSRKPIELIEAGDRVLSFDAAGRLVPGRVARVSVTRATQVLDFHGTKVTPGHVYLCGDGPFAGRYVTLIDILRSDGAVVLRDGAMMRAATGALLGTEADSRMVWIALGDVDAGGHLQVRDAAQVRLGLRVRTAAGQDLALADLIAAAGAEVTEAGLIRPADGSEAMLHWTLTDRLPRPEDYVLARSAADLAAIYAAGEWEDQRPVLPAPFAARRSADAGEVLQ